MQTGSSSGNGQWKAQTPSGEPQIRRFLFDTCFDDEGEEEPAAGESETVEPPPPSFTLEDLEKARSEGFAAGQSEGLAEALKGLAANTDCTLERIAAELAEIAHRQEAANETLLREAARVAVTIMRKLMPYLAERHGTDEVMTFLREFLKPMTGCPAITVRVAEAVAAEVEKRLRDSGTVARIEGRLVVEGDADLTSADCSIDWGAGGAVRSVECVWREIDTAVERFLADTGIPASSIDANAAASSPDSGPEQPT